MSYLADGRIVARAAICAAGVDYPRLGLPNEEKFTGAGIYYRAGASEAFLCDNERVFIVGGGNSAEQASLYFAAIARKVTLVVRDETLKATVSAYLIDRIYSNERIEVLTNTVATAVDGDTVLRSITLTNRNTSKSQTYPTRWVFVCIGGIRVPIGLLPWAFNATKAGTSLPVSTSVAMESPLKAGLSIANLTIWKPMSQGICSGGCPLRLREALRCSGRRGRNGRHVCASLPCFGIAKQAIERSLG